MNISKNKISKKLKIAKKMDSKPNNEKKGFISHKKYFPNDKDNQIRSISHSLS